MDLIGQNCNSKISSYRNNARHFNLDTRRICVYVGRDRIRDKYFDVYRRFTNARADAIFHFIQAFKLTITLEVVFFCSIHPWRAYYTRLNGFRGVIKASTRVRFCFLNDRYNEGSYFCRLTRVFIAPNRYVTRFL